MRSIGRVAAFSAGLVVASLRLEAAPIQVTNTVDSGAGSLRQAILDANAAPGLDTITFAIPGPGLHSIHPASPLPVITEAVVLDGYSQPGSSANTLSTGDNAILTIEIDGNVVTITGGLIEVSGGGSTIQGLVIVNAQGGNGILLRDAGANTVAGNFIGVRADGATGAGNGCAGVRVTSDGNTIGGTAPAARNLIAATQGCSIDVVIEGNANKLQGNMIGTSATGTSALGGSVGVHVSGASNWIGGAAGGAGNLISGHANEGVRFGTGSSGNYAEGNRIGTDAAGTAALGNQTGISVFDSPNNVIGGTTAGSGNLVSGNYYGILIGSPGATGNLVAGNIVGLNAAGDAALPNVQGIQIFSASNNTIGSGTPSGRNVISGNTTGGLDIGMADGTRVLGNFIGTDATGMKAIGNLHSINVDLSTGVLIGGSTPPLRNVIAESVAITSCVDTVVRGNSMGTTVLETALLPNRNSFGSAIFVVFGSGTVIGGKGPGDGNVICGNGFGISIVGPAAVLGNFIGTNRVGATGLGNSNQGIEAEASCSIGDGTPAGANVIAYNGYYGIVVPSAGGVAIRGNRMYGNVSNIFFGVPEIGIDLGNDGVTINDPGDADTGPNGRQNFPLIRTSTVDAANTSIVGSLNSLASTVYTLDFFSNPACAGSGYGEGKTFLGSSQITTDASGNASFQLTFPTLDPTETVITATATDPDGNTSEFSACAAAAKLYTIPPCRLVDTRDPAGPFGGPSVGAGETRTFPLAGRCGIPATATAVALQIVAVAPGAPGVLTVWPGGGAVPNVSALNYDVGKTRANNSVVSLGGNADISLLCNQASSTTDIVIDVTGYFQ